MNAKDINLIIEKITQKVSVGGHSLYNIYLEGDKSDIVLYGILAAIGLGLICASIVLWFKYGRYLYRRIDERVRGFLNYDEYRNLSRFYFWSALIFAVLGLPLFLVFITGFVRAAVSPHYWAFSKILASGAELIGVK